VRYGARAFFIGAGLAALASCDYWVGDPAVTLPDESAWLVLPMRAFVTNPDIRVDGMQLCTRAKCGYDAAVERFTATGEEARSLERSLAQPRQIAHEIDAPERGSRTPPPKVAIEDFGNGGWSGLHVAMTGGAKARHVDGYVVSRRGQAGTTFIVVIAADDAVSKRLIDSATR